MIRHRASGNYALNDDRSANLFVLTYLDTVSMLVKRKTTRLDCV